MLSILNRSFVVSMFAACAIAWPCVAQDETRTATVDASSLHHKVMCGYQGWLRCPGDGTNEGWLHWSRRANSLTAESLTVEMWPDMTEYGPNERYPVPDLTGADESHCLFSSANPRTVQRHFEWMRDYGLDGVFVQRFLVNLRKPSFDLVLSHVRSSAKRTGRTYAIGYDLSGVPASRVYDLLANDWKRLVDDDKITQDDRYLHHNGRPVVFVWGFFADRFDAALAHRIIDLFQQDDRYRATLIGGCQWHWRGERDPAWARAFRRFDVISPWNVGNYATVNGQRIAATHYWKDDLAEAQRHAMEYLPVIYPGFGWTNLKGSDARRATIPRRGGEFFWEQFVAASRLDIQMAYVAMFDEVDEATAIFKVSNSPPLPNRFQTYEGLPTDWYLRLTGQGTKLIRGERQAADELPIRAFKQE
ncbi:MAG: hypothetical protein KDA55_18945 [Planctomycetales bacterium]|nr:hypothetical protein [Planctomycetales bacterium]